MGEEKRQNQITLYTLHSSAEFKLKNLGGDPCMLEKASPATTSTDASHIPQGLDQLYQRTIGKKREIRTAISLSLALYFQIVPKLHQIFTHKIKKKDGSENFYAVMTGRKKAPSVNVNDTRTATPDKKHSNRSVTQLRWGRAEHSNRPMNASHGTRY
jgi:hypothetical protein